MLGSEVGCTVGCMAGCILTHLPLMQVDMPSHMQDFEQ